MAIAKRLLALAVVAIFSYDRELVLGACSVSGCQPDRCFCASIPKRLTANPPLQWSKPVQMTEGGCLANGGRIVCPLSNTTGPVRLAILNCLRDESPTARARLFSLSF